MCVCVCVRVCVCVWCVSSLYKWLHTRLQDTAELMHGFREIISLSLSLSLPFSLSHAQTNTHTHHNHTHHQPPDRPRAIMIFTRPVVFAGCGCTNNDSVDQAPPRPITWRTTQNNPSGRKHTQRPDQRKVITKHHIH